jgi:hypothetical protein
MPRLLPLVCISIAVLMAALAAACDKSPTAPDRLVAAPRRSAWKSPDLARIPQQFV